MGAVRRKFYDLQVAHKSPIAQEALERIAALYAIEKGPWPSTRRAAGDTTNPPAQLLESLHEWLELLDQAVAEIGHDGSREVCAGTLGSADALRGKW